MHVTILSRYVSEGMPHFEKTKSLHFLRESGHWYNLFDYNILIHISLRFVG